MNESQREDYQAAETHRFLEIVIEDAGGSPLKIVRMVAPVNANASCPITLRIDALHMCGCRMNLARLPVPPYD